MLGYASLTQPTFTTFTTVSGAVAVNRGYVAYTAFQNGEYISATSATGESLLFVVFVVDGARSIPGSWLGVPKPVPGLGPYIIEPTVPPGTTIGWAGMATEEGQIILLPAETFSQGLAAGRGPVIVVGTTIVAPNNVFRGDANLTSPLNSKGIPKSSINEAGDLVPANAAGAYKGRQVSVGEHILGGYRRGAKSNSPFTSFTPDGQIAGAYGGQTVSVDVNALRAAIARGELTGVEILDQAAIQNAIRNDALLSDHWRNLASRWAARDQEVLIRGVIPKRFIKVD